MLVATQITRRFGPDLILDRVQLTINRGDRVGLIGPNGAGKTTFINCIAGVNRPDSGSATWMGREILGLSPAALLGLGVARTFQSLVLLHELTTLCTAPGL